MQAANLYQLHNFSLKINYSSSSLDGKPRLTYQKGRTEHTFSGREIVREETAAGTLLTVKLSATPDSKTVYFSLLLPQVNIPDNAREAPVHTRAFETTSRTSIGGPALVKGQVQTYKSYSLKGSASAVVF